MAMFSPNNVLDLQAISRVTLCSRAIWGVTPLLIKPQLLQLLKIYDEAPTPGAASDVEVNRM